MILAAAIFDVDGVLLASPHERAWREALTGFADPARFATAMYQADVAGARAALRALGWWTRNARRPHMPGGSRHGWRS